eukprot:TRINITY_DN47466_c0_g1_i1.p1 TRINITY_DN47466_c0_g1~~TRINITY_DN47466_c0_g1_i1.p1  ORF type:complete len:118 (+),score=17.57 TRINITY_DN47466_c0_g1_i1:155-508(+)
MLDCPSQSNGLGKTYIRGKKQFLSHLSALCPDPALALSLSRLSLAPSSLCSSMRTSISHPSDHLHNPLSNCTRLSSLNHQRFSLSLSLSLSLSQKINICMPGTQPWGLHDDNPNCLT